MHPAPHHAGNFSGQRVILTEGPGCKRALNRRPASQELVWRCDQTVSHSATEIRALS